RLRSQHRVHRQPRDACNNPLACRSAFAQPYMGKRGIREHAVCNDTIARCAIPSCQIVTNDAKIVFGYVRELWAAGAFSNGPDPRRTRLQSPIHANVTTTVQLNPRLLKADSVGIGNTSSRD